MFALTGDGRVGARRSRQSQFSRFDNYAGPAFDDDDSGLTPQGAWRIHAPSRPRIGKIDESGYCPN
ncbi:hypothetical protein M2367_000037 [Aeromonas sp. BIGb0445]|nr:hypothetical protein [Aeromonas sp. BIGb0445]